MFFKELLSFIFPRPPFFIRAPAAMAAMALVFLPVDLTGIFAIAAFRFPRLVCQGMAVVSGQARVANRMAINKFHPGPFRPRFRR